MSDLPYDSNNPDSAAKFIQSLRQSSVIPSVQKEQAAVDPSEVKIKVLPSGVKLYYQESTLPNGLPLRKVIRIEQPPPKTET